MKRFNPHFADTLSQPAQICLDAVFGMVAEVLINNALERNRQVGSPCDVFPLFAYFQEQHHLSNNSAKEQERLLCQIIARYVSSQSAKL